MGKHNNNGGRQMNGIGSANQRNNGNGRNGIQGSMSDGKRFITESRDTKSFDITTQNVQDFFRSEAKRVDAAIKNRLGDKAADFETEVSIMSLNLSSPSEKQPYVPFFMVVSSNIIDSAGSFNNIPKVFRPDIDDGVHINNVYYEMLFRKFMYDKDDIKMFNLASTRKALNISASFKVLNTVKSYMKPKIEFPNGNKEDIANAKVAVMIDPIRVFQVLAYEPNIPRYRVCVKEAAQIDSTNFYFRVERYIDHKKNSSAENLALLKQFLASGNSGLRS